MTANELVDTLREQFIGKNTTPSEWEDLIRDNHIEQRDVKGYHGREILELLQNADDAYQKLINSGKKPDCELEVIISYVNDVLTISNTGTVFDDEGVKAIVQGNNSPKKGGYIGNKGTGFRSILNWAKAVSIDSGEFHIIFSEEIASSIFESIRNKPQILKQLEKEPKLYVPMLAVPENKLPENASDKTTIKIAINPNKSNDEYSVQKQIDELDLRILLFLPNVSRIYIETETEKIEFQRVKDSQTPEILLEKKVNGNIIVKEDFLLFEKKLENFAKIGNESKDACIAIAVSKSLSEMENIHLYSFFPVLKATSPFKCLFHATYELDDQRNNLLINQINYDIIKEQLLFLFGDVADYFVNQGDFRSLYEIITPQNIGLFIFQEPFFSFTKFGLEEFYLDLFGKSKIFKTINGAVKSLQESPKVIKGNYPKSFKGDSFENLLEQTDNKNILELIKRYSDRHKLTFDFSETDLLESVNKQSNYWSIQEQIEVFIWWNEKNFKSLPNLLKNGNNEWIKYKDECFFLVGSFVENFIPKWACIPTMNWHYQKELLEQSELLPEIIRIKNNSDSQPTPRIISQNNIFPSVNFKYLDKNTVLSSVNASVDSYENAENFVKWLWENYNEDGWQPPNTINFRFPAVLRDGKKINTHSQKIYFGKEYKNRLGNLLFDDSYGSFPALTNCGINENKDSLVKFVCKFGVKNFPVIEEKEIYSCLERYGEYYKNLARKTEGKDESVNASCKFIIPYIENLETILRRLDTKDVVEWIVDDRNLFAYLSKPLYDETYAKVFYKVDKQITFSHELKNVPVRNYILETFNEIPWIQIENVRYSPRQVLNGENSRIISKFSKLLPIINYKYISEIAEEIGVKYDVVSDIFKKFDLCESPVGLPSNQFYGLMLQIPKLDFNEAEDLSRTLYRFIEQPEFRKKYDYSDNLQKFKQNGELLVRYKGVLKFFKASESYLPSAKIVNKNEIPIVEKGPRTNNENFKRLFGCKEYDKDYEIVGKVISDADEQFQDYFSEFKKYAQAYSVKNSKIDEFGPKLNIRLMSRIDVLTNSGQSMIDEEYFPIRETVSSWFITCFEKTADYKKISIAIENIYENVANTPQFDAGKIGELFRESEKSGREFLIKKEFGSLDVIDDRNYEIELKNIFITTVKKINADYDVNAQQIDFEHFESELSIKGIIRVLNELKIDIDQFQKKGFSYSINLVPYYKEVLKKIIRDESRNFKNYLFTKIKRGNYSELTVDDLKNKFLTEHRQFESYNIHDIPNSISFDVKKEIKKQFGDWESASEILDADKEYSKNSEEMNPEKKFQDEISLNENVQVMIYFHKNEEFKNWIETKEVELSQTEDDKKKDVYAELRNVVPNKASIDYRVDVHFSEPEHERTRHDVFTNSRKTKRERNQKIVGNKGELLIFNLLCKEYGRENVFPMSEAYVELGIIEAGLDKNCGYDIAYKDSAGTEFHVEVKTGDSQSFFLSPDELKYAKDNAEIYKLFCVYNLDKDPPDYIELPRKFWKDSRYKKRDIVEKIEFRW